MEVLIGKLRSTEVKLTEEIKNKIYDDLRACVVSTCKSEKVYQDIKS